MSNMSYCRFVNTVSDLQDCYDHLNDRDLSDREKKARIRLIELCEEITQEAIPLRDDEKDEEDD